MGRGIFTLRKHAYSNSLKILPPKDENFQIKKIWYFSYFCSKHRLWVLVKTASKRRFQRIPTINVLSRNKKNNVYPCKPQFYCIKVGFKGIKIILACFCDEDVCKQWRCRPASERAKSDTDLCYTVKLQWLEHFWDHGNLFETWVVRTIEGSSWC